MESEKADTMRSLRCLRGEQMKNISCEGRVEMPFFINPNTKKVEYNKLCAKCANKCKQSFRAIVVYCPKYKPKKEARNEAK